MDQSFGMIVGAAVLAMAMAFVAVHYCRERIWRKRLRMLDHRCYAWRWKDPRR
jgi:hypothetical protein